MTIGKETRELKSYLNQQKDMIISLITSTFQIHFEEKYFHIESISTPHYDRRDLRSTSKRKNSSASSAAIEDQSRRKI